jgi:peroxiredoxin
MSSTAVLALASVLLACRDAPQCADRPRACGEPTGAADTGLQPGEFLAPLEELARIYDGGEDLDGWLADTMHVDEVRYRAAEGWLFYCSYTFGVIDANDPAAPTYLTQGHGWDITVPGTGATPPTGCTHLDWDDDDPDLVYVSHRGNADFPAHLSVVDLGAQVPEAGEPIALDPTLGEPLREPTVSYEGLDAENGYVYVALHDRGIGVYETSRGDPLRSLSRVGGDDTIVANAYDIEVVGDLAYVLDEQAGLYVLDVADRGRFAEVGHLFLGGLARDLRVDGDYAYIAAGAAGLLIVDVSDPTAPALVSQTPTHGTAVRVGYDDDRVSVAAWNDTRVYDVSDRARPAIIGAARLEQTLEYTTADGDTLHPDITSRVLGTEIHGDTLFVGDWRTPYTFAIHADRVAPYLVLPEDVFYMGIGNVKVGATGSYEIRAENQGTADLTVYEALAEGQGFDMTPAEARIPPGGEVTFAITYTAETTEEARAIIRIRSDDPTQPERVGLAVANPVGIGVGDPFPYTEATDVQTLATWTSDELAGKVGLVAYFATFCPVCSIELPDIQNRLFERYGPEGLAIIALDPDPDDFERPDAVATYAENLGVTFPVALETSAVTPTYATISDIYQGESPYPLDILIDRDGKIRYVAREYDPDALEEQIVELLAE